MTLKLKATRKEFELTDESGYSFSVVAIMDDEWGWSAHLSVDSRGMATDDAALAALVPALEHALRMLRTSGGTTP